MLLGAAGAGKTATCWGIPGSQVPQGEHKVSMSIKVVESNYGISMEFIEMFIERFFSGYLMSKLSSSSILLRLINHLEIYINGDTQ